MDKNKNKKSVPQSVANVENNPKAIANEKPLSIKETIAKNREIIEKNRELLKNLTLFCPY